MNQVKTGCANCYYYFNGYCTYGNICSGVTCVKPDANGHLITLPVDAPVVSAIEPQLATHCLVCGKQIFIHKFEEGPKICEECKKAIEWAKGQVATARKVEYDPSRLKEITKEQEPIDKITDEKEKAIELIQNTFNLSEFSIFGFEHDLFNGKLTLYDFAKGIINLITDNKIKKS